MADATYEIKQALLAAHDLQDWLISNRYRDVKAYSCLENAIDPVYSQVRHIIMRLDLALGKLEDLQ